MTQFTIFPVELLRLVTSDDIMTSLLKNVNIDQNSRQTAMFSKLSTESVGSRRELVANRVHTADADATQLDSFVASAVCIIGHTVLGFNGPILPDLRLIQIRPVSKLKMFGNELMWLYVLSVARPTAYYGKDFFPISPHENP